MWGDRPSAESLGYCPSSLAGLQNGVRRVESLFVLGDELEARLAAAQWQVNAHTPALL